MLVIIGELLLPAVIGYGKEPLDALRLDIGVENHFAVQVSRGPASRLD